MGYIRRGRFVPCYWIIWKYLHTRSYFLLPEGLFRVQCSVNLRVSRSVPYFWLEWSLPATVGSSVLLLSLPAALSISLPSVYVFWDVSVVMGFSGAGVLGNEMFRAKLARWQGCFFDKNRFVKKKCSWDAAIPHGENWKRSSGRVLESWKLKDVHGFWNAQKITQCSLKHAGSFGLFPINSSTRSILGFSL